MAKREWKSYMDLLKERGQSNKNRVSKSFQMTGLAIARMLHDEDHKGLYIKLAKTHDRDFLMNIAKDVAQRGNIENKGGYFMKVLQEKKKQRERLNS
ncbi:MAG: hypothetical protein WDZ80_06390 [Candidatus Paceibacterota bacterium]